MANFRLIFQLIDSFNTLINEMLVEITDKNMKISYFAAASYIYLDLIFALKTASFSMFASKFQLLMVINLHSLKKLL